MNPRPFEINLGNVLFQNIFGLIRLFLVYFTLRFFASTYSSYFHQILPMDLFSTIRNPYIMRYILPPLTAILCVLVLGAFYVKDIYALPSIGTALRYVIASTFALFYPILKVDKGVKQVKKGQVNLIDSIGGPGNVLIEPGSAAVFRDLRGPSGSLIAGTYFLKPFETIAHTMDLDEQQGDKNDIKCMSRDGIKVKINDIHYRYRIKADDKEGRQIQRNVNTPYPFDEDALAKMAYNQSVRKGGEEEPWSAGIDRAVVGQITDFVAEHTIDYLTAPRKDENPPREELVRWIYNTSTPIMNNLGAELLWVDVGHIEIVEDIVDDERTNLWSADWVGDATVTRAYGEAKRLAYQELGRAEAQAELIISIADALSSANLPENSAENVRRILLARTAQLLDALSSKYKTNPETRL